MALYIDEAHNSKPSEYPMLAGRLRPTDFITVRTFSSFLTTSPSKASPRHHSVARACKEGEERDAGAGVASSDPSAASAEGD
ncbi:hypothetical protein CVT26_003902 [Gymnopilus dilepis]|uniref:Uncharacterized protein n=1 Tax=Gymnopilus dilepis TaxID=231916 RepID=A0A409W704_9AGAR|nr:hypothetical protein CVT26_003902 [Gymnopilus dilepis]